MQTRYLYLLLLAGCAVQRGVDLPQLPDWETRQAVLSRLDDWEFKGRVAVKAGEEGFNANLRWRQEGDVFHAALSGPLGIGTVRIEGDGEAVAVTDNDGKVHHLEDADGRHWLSFGSFWSGLRIVEVEPATGKPLEGAAQVTLASRPVPEGAPGAVEAPFIIRRGAYYYLFASYDYCCRGVASSYYIVVGRAARPTGPYLGRDGRRMLDGYGTLLLQGNRQFRGPGHNAVLVDEDADYLVYHAYDAANGGAPTLRVRPLRWTDDAWPAVDG